MTVEIVSSVQQAIDHINLHGSHHTDCIITASHENALQFTQSVDSACTFVNVSTSACGTLRANLWSTIACRPARASPMGSGLLSASNLRKRSSFHLGSVFAGLA
jgi:glutamate-5-semialdehyde dehydrogenase